MTALPRRLDEIDGLVRVGEIPAAVAAAWNCGTLMVQVGTAVFVVDDAQLFPAGAAREGIELRSAALIEGVCPECRAIVRPALAAMPGSVVQFARDARDAHAPDCAAHEAQIAAALEGEDGSDDRTERRNSQ